MNVWFNKNMGDAMFAREELDRLAARFTAFLRSTEIPDTAAVFYRHESEGRLHCEVMVYFSPAARIVSEAVGAVPCPKPASQGLNLLAGSDASWSLLFNEPNQPNEPNQT
ncbi:MAG: hypothetical protein WBY88_14885 [Desulfosarcina sp.]